MKRSPKPTVLHVRDAENLDIFIREAKRVWQEAHPDRRRTRGRPSQREADRRAIAAIAKNAGGLSGPSMTLWTQGEWIKKIGSFKGQSAPAPETIKKNLKRYIEGRPFPIHLISPTFIKTKPLDEQLRHWYGVAIAEALLSDCRPLPGGRRKIPYKRLNAIHRKLCETYIPKKRRCPQMPESERQAWFDSQWKCTKPGAVESRTSPSPSPLTP